MKRIVLHVDRLVLRGWRGVDARAVGAALRGELARWLADPAARERLAARGDVRALQLGKVRVEHEATPARIARSLARSIARGISR